MKHLPDGLYSGPLVLFDQHDNVVIISPFNHFTAASYAHDITTNSIGWGVMGNVDSIPAGYELETLAFVSTKGINQVRPHALNHNMLLNNRC